jgi:hypothetical protein
MTFNKANSNVAHKMLHEKRQGNRQRNTRWSVGGQVCSVGVVGI